METPDCLRCRTLLSAAMDGEATFNETEFVRRHLAGCPDCREAQQAYNSLRAQLRLMPTPEPPVALRMAVMSRINGKKAVYARPRPVLLLSPWQKGLFAAAVLVLVFVSGFLLSMLLFTKPFEVDGPVVADTSGQKVVIIFTRPVDRNYIMANAPTLFAIKDAQNNPLQIDTANIVIDGNRVELPIKRDSGQLQENEQIEVVVAPQLKDDKGAAVANPGPKVALVGTQAPEVAVKPTQVVAVATTPVPPTSKPAVVTTAPASVTAPVVPSNANPTATTAPPATTASAQTTVPGTTAASSTTVPTTAPATMTAPVTTTTPVSTTVAVSPTVPVTTTVGGSPAPSISPSVPVTTTPVDLTPSVTPTATDTTSPSTAPATTPGTATATVPATVPPTATKTPAVTVGVTPTPVISATAPATTGPSTSPNTLMPSTTVASPSPGPSQTTASCKPVELGPGFEQLYLDVEARIGCPTAAPTRAAFTYQVFQKGTMLYYQQTGRIYVFYNFGGWASYRATGPVVVPPTPVPPTTTPGGTPTPDPTGCGLKPRGSFAALWTGNQAVQSSLGCPVGVDSSTAGGMTQSFSRGFMLFNPLATLPYSVVYGDGGFQSYLGQ